jgi:ABC-type nitrate/sulfonate/bicarbonate transport system permease component
VLAVIVLICLLGLLAQYSVALLESRVLHWRLRK